jgi:hypothetical protein
MKNLLSVAVIGIAIGALSLSTVIADTTSYVEVSKCIEREALSQGFPSPHSQEAWTLFAESCI